MPTSNVSLCVADGLYYAWHLSSIGKFSFGICWPSGMWRSERQVLATIGIYNFANFASFDVRVLLNK